MRIYIGNRFDSTFALALITMSIELIPPPHPAKGNSFKPTTGIQWNNKCSDRSIEVKLPALFRK